MAPKRSGETSPDGQAVPSRSAVDAAAIIAGLSRINDPVVSYFLAMLIGHIAEIAGRSELPIASASLEGYALEPHAVPYDQKPVMHGAKA